MIKSVSIDQAIIGQLAASPFTFELTGSRFFGTENGTSDWDFFTDARATHDETIPGSCQGGSYDTIRPVTVEQALVKMGFHVDPRCGRYEEKTYYKGRIHVQLTLTPKRKAEIQKKMKMFMTKDDLRVILGDKVQAKRVWTAMNSIYGPERCTRGW